MSAQTETGEVSRIRTFEQAEQVLAAALPNYQARPQQQQLAAFVEGVIADQGWGLAEAGTGTGKSLATVIPAILSGAKVIVCTATKALQDQYASKDLPFLEEHLTVPFSWANLKGRSNYLCLAKAYDATDLAKAPNGQALLAEITDNPNHDGDLDGFEAEVTDRDRWALSMTAADCPGTDCPFRDQCFAQKAKGKAQSSQVVVTNHMMMMTELKLREQTDGAATMLGNFDLVMFDEAHELEDWATKALQAEVKERGLTMLLAEAETFARENGQTLHTLAETARLRAEVWDMLPNTDNERLTLSWFLDRADSFAPLIEALRDLGVEINNIKLAGDARRTAKRTRLVTRCFNEANDLSEALTTDESLMVRWVKVTEDRRTRQTVKDIITAPVHVGAYLSEWLWEATPSILLSATLSVGGDFSYVSGRLGLPMATKSMSVGTPFDYQKQAMLFVPPSQAPSPKERTAWLSYSTTMSQELVMAAGGGALLLFTSRSAMDQAYETLASSFEAKGLKCYRQGDAPNRVLARQFSEDTHSVLFALKSFMTGVDFQGDTCRLVIIDKLPFPVPTEPVFSARADQIKRRGGNDFGQLTIPMMTLTLEQAYGRLIRTTSDRGVVAILDSRLSSTGYGRQIVKNLPESPRTTNLADVQAFYQHS